jgi:hypothetical protein
MKSLQASEAGGGEDNAVRDIMELTAILLIPILKKSADELVRVPLPQGAQAPPPASSSKWRTAEDPSGIWDR